MQGQDLPPTDPWPTWGTVVLGGVVAGVAAFVSAQLYESSLNAIWLLFAWMLGAGAVFALLAGAVAFGVRMGTSDLQSLIETVVRTKR